MLQLLRAFTLCLLLFSLAAAQPRRASYGPVVTAYLTGLAEELSELEYQITHREIGLAEYARAKQRLSLLRRFVTSSAARGGEDVVPELQALCEDELGALGTSGAVNPNELKIGAELDGRWKLLSIEPSAQSRRSGERFFIFEQLRPRSNALPRPAAPASVIETIVVREIPPAPPREDLAAAPIAAPPQNHAAAPRSLEERPKMQPLRILHIYLPEYTDKARQSRLEGELIVRAMFQRDGKIKNIKIEKGLGQGLDERAAESVRRIGFLPARFEGREGRCPRCDCLRFQTCQGFRLRSPRRS